MGTPAGAPGLPLDDLALIASPEPTVPVVDTPSPARFAVSMGNEPVFDTMTLELAHAG